MRRLLFLQTFGERYGKAGHDVFTPSDLIQWASEPVVGPRDMKDVAYDPKTSQLKVGDGNLCGVSPEVWNFAVSGMPIMRKWLGYRTHKGAGKAASSKSPLDQIRPDSWDPAWSLELRELVHVLAESDALVGDGDVLLGEILESKLIAAQDLPEVDPQWRKAPPSTEWWLETNTLF